MPAPFVEHSDGIRQCNADKARELPRQVEVVVGDLTHPDSLAPAVSGINAIVFTHGTVGEATKGAETVDYAGVRDVLVALGGRKVRTALMTAIGVTDRRGAHDWKRRGERLVRASGLPIRLSDQAGSTITSPTSTGLSCCRGIDVSQAPPVMVSWHDSNSRRCWYTASIHRKRCVRPSS